MSTNPQWKSFQPPVTMNQDSAILDYKTMTSNGKSAQAFNFRSGTSYSGDYPLHQDKSPNSSYNPYNSSSTSSTTSNNARSTSRFPPIGTFSLDSNNMFNSGDNITTSSATTPNNSSPFCSTNSNSNGNSSSTYDNNAANLGTRETGIIEKLLHSYGFIQCCERQARLFFHFSQFSGNIEHLKIGDPVEFEMTYDRRTGKPIASTVTKIAPEVMSEERVTGTVTTELKTEGSGGDTQGRISYENRGECFFLPYTKDDVEGNVTLQSGDKVSFQIAANNRGNLGACHVRLENPAHPVKYQGVVCSMKESFGFIERADVVKEIFFHFSEAKSMKEELRLGDDVEFIIQTRNGKEVACNITRLAPGTVIFEDVKQEMFKGQVLKPLDRGQNVRHQNDALPGRIRYRAPDHSEVEIPFGDKDQKGDFTLRHGDWVQFKIATDRRDQLNRATNISLLEESFVVSGEKREQGVVASIKDGFGFLRCVEREPRLFFHFNEVLDVDLEPQPNDEFEFTVVQDQSSTFANNRQSAIRMKRLSAGSVQFEVLSESAVTGVVCKEISSGNSNWSNRSPTKNQNNGGGGAGAQSNGDMESGLITYQLNGVKKTVSFFSKDCDPKNTPRVGDKVEFNVNQVKRTKELIAVDVQVLVASNHMVNGNSGGKNNRSSSNLPVYQGFVAALKDGFGFIETIEHDREVFFHFSNFEGDANNLELGQEVEYNLGNSRGNSGSCSSAENVRVIPKGTIELPVVSSEVLDGVIVRPLRSVNPDQAEYSGLVRINSGGSQDGAGSGADDSSGSSTNGDAAPAPNTTASSAAPSKEAPATPPQAEYEFGIMGLVNKRELLQVGDPVQLQVDSSGRAANILAVRKKRRATVDAIKGLFGFLAYEVDEGKKLFFHTTEVKDNVNLQVGDTVEFVLVTNHRNGKSSACNVVKVSDVQARPERLISRLRTVSLDEAGPRLTVVRQPRGPDGSRGFSLELRAPRLPGSVHE